jgi:hypothetical protein
MPGSVDSRHPGSEAQVDFVLGVPALRMDIDLLFLGLALQVAFRQRRPFIGPLDFLPDENDVPLEAVLPLGPLRFWRRPVPRRR